MDQETLAQTTVRQEGDTLFHGLSTITLWNLLVANGVLPRQQALAALDAALLVMEHRRENWIGDLGIIDQARMRMEALIGQIKVVPSQASRPPLF